MEAAAIEVKGGSQIKSQIAPGVSIVAPAGSQRSRFHAQRHPAADSARFDVDAANTSCLAAAARHSLILR